MGSPLKSAITYATLIAVLAWVVPIETLAADGPARLEGLVVGTNGRPAAEHRIHLINDSGRDVAQSEVGEDGLYSFSEVAQGSYALGVELPDGTVAPVAAPPVRLRRGELARRDLQLLQADPADVDRAVQANYGLGTWWAGLTKAGKAWTAIAIVTALALTIEALDDEESPSQFQTP